MFTNYKKMQKKWKEIYLKPEIYSKIESNESSKNNRAIDNWVYGGKKLFYRYIYRGTKGTYKRL